VGQLLVLVVAVLALVLYLVPVPLWIAAWASGAYVGLFTLIAMRLRRVPPTTIVTARISAVKAGIDISINDLEAHFLAGGNVVRVVNAMISADKANIPLPFKRAAAIDLAGRNVLEAVQMSVLPKVIETPRIAAVAKDGIQLIAVSRVTVRTNIDRLVGGAGEETIIARVGEGMVSTIGSAQSHKDVLENPDHISKHILSKGLDAGTAYEILSIDIADVDVGENIGAKLQIDQANADKQIAQAKAEERRAMAVALEQEMRARVVEAEAEVPRAMAEAFRQGNLGIMDYYRMKNLQADTAMREEIANTGQEGAMSGLPEELIFLLIFGFVWLVQFLRRQRRRPAPPASEAERKAEAEADARAEAEADAWANAQTGPVPRAPAFTPNLAEGPRRAPVRRDRPAPTPSARQSARRYSRSALMGDRRAVQNAIVVAAILQPCRARRPYGAE
jgi:uncharacterized protein YqfA (UPF0365 family)